MNRKLIIAIPLALFLALTLVFAVQLLRGGNSSVLPSALIGKPAPDLPLEQISTVSTPVLNSEFLSQLSANKDVIVVNIWASWCAPCRIEHPQIESLSNLNGVSVVGINYKDTDDGAARFLHELGNPYAAIGADRAGKNSINLGVYGVPETFILDQNNVIHAKFVGPITDERLSKEVLPEIEKLLN